MPVNEPMNTCPGVVPAGSIGGKSIDDAPVSRAAVPVGNTGLLAVQIAGVLPVVVKKNGNADTLPVAP